MLIDALERNECGSSKKKRKTTASSSSSKDMDNDADIAKQISNGTCVSDIVCLFFITSHCVCSETTSTMSSDVDNGKSADKTPPMAAKRIPSAFAAMYANYSSSSSSRSSEKGSPLMRKASKRKLSEID